MLIVCPSCGGRHSLDAAVADADARRAVERALSLPALGAPAIHYLACFRPAKGSLRWSRAAALLDELAGVVEAGRVERGGRTWEVPAEVWPEAFEAVLAARDAGRLRRPLKSHGYLFEAAAGIAERRAGEAETRRDEERRAAGRRAAGARNERDVDGWASLRRFGAAAPATGEESA